MAPTRRRGRREARAPGRPLPSPRRPSAVMAVAAAGAGAPRASSRPRGRGAVAGVRGGAGGAPLPPAARARARRPPARLAGTRAAEARGGTGGARGGAGDQPDPGGGEPAAAQADTGCGRGTQAGPGMGSARDRPLAGDPQRCATTGSGPIWGSPPTDAKDGVKTPACREQLNRPVVPHPFKIGDSV
ncbi:uncharacterized protein LOC143272559 [Peromyscus maniculatus bairdii]|uniref:uncharacterized protein LOC143272559 n=1 Tax=Peromyscus maniculatus bairdii TaxID=230844 RepID=UPI003FCF1D6F